MTTLKFAIRGGSRAESLSEKGAELSLNLHFYILRPMLLLIMFTNYFNLSYSTFEFDRLKFYSLTFQYMHFNLFKMAYFAKERRTCCLSLRLQALKGFQVSALSEI
jgi:hypothetical protein